MRGLKPFSTSNVVIRLCRIFYRCVDWNKINLKCITFFVESHLLQMRGLKREYIPPTVSNIKSHLLQMRGLKPYQNYSEGYSKRSHLLQMRGLKRHYLNDWGWKIGRIFYRCVDWNLNGKKTYNRWISRIFYRCVDWNSCCCTPFRVIFSRIFYRCVDWNFGLLIFAACLEFNL